MHSNIEPRPRRHARNIRKEPAIGENVMVPNLRTPLALVPLRFTDRAPSMDAYRVS